MNKKNSIHKKIDHSPEDKARRKALREKLQREKPAPEELASAGYGEPIPQGVVLDTMRLLGMLRKAREAAGLTLADMAGRTGMDVAALSRLETGKADNPTLQTILRYAGALGKRLTWALEDEPPAGERQDPGNGSQAPETAESIREAFADHLACLMGAQEALCRLLETDKSGRVLWKGPPGTARPRSKRSGRLSSPPRTHPLGETSLESLGRRLDALLADPPSE